MKRLVPILLLLLTVSLAYAADIPQLTGYVTDNADIIELEYEQELTSLIQQIEQETTAEIAILTVTNLQGMPIEMYSIELAEKNKVGKQGEDNGIIIVVSEEDREYRIEVGYGLEDKIPDITAGRIGDDLLVPYFVQQRFGEGLIMAVKDIEGILSGDQAVISQYDGNEDHGLNYFGIIVIIYIVMMMISSNIIRYSKKKSSTRRGFLILVFLFLVITAVVRPSIILTIGLSIITIVFFAFSFLPPSPGKRGFYFGGGFSGGHGGFGSSGFGGFGGGGFGGGGAGGSW